MRVDRVLVLQGIFVVGGFVLFLRLFQVQVLEHSVWAEEAARLVHSGREIPYRRGRILDTNGVVLARDKDTHNLCLYYRDFRRGHALGQVAHARSLLEDRPVSLQEARASLFEWAWELVNLSPLDLEEFARGAALETETLWIEPTESPREENRARRAKDLGFYIRRMLLERDSDRRAMERFGRDEGKALTYLMLATTASPGEDTNTDETWLRLEARMSRMIDRLSNLADLLEWPDGATGVDAPVDLLVRELESTRRWVEDATATKLFREAAGFAPGRIDPSTLYTRIDVSWIARLLGWDDERVLQWTETTRADWKTNWRDGYALPRLLLQLTLDPAFTPRPDDVLCRAASVFMPSGAVTRILEGAAPVWPAVHELGVLNELDSLFAARFGRDVERNTAPILPIQTLAFGARHDALRAKWDESSAKLADKRVLADRLKPERRAARSEELDQLEDRFAEDYWRLVDDAWSGDSQPGCGAEMQRLLASGRWDAPDRLLVRTIELLDDWDVEYQAAITERLDALIAGATARELTADGRLLIAEENRDHAAERAEFFLKDYGRRARPLMRGEPSYNVIYLLTRYREDYAGLDARPAREREYLVPPGDGVRVAPGLIGNVSAIGIDDVLEQFDDRQRMRALKDRAEKTEDERDELKGLVSRVLLDHEVKGVAGVEGYWNQELIGRNGYQESFGLEDVFGSGRDETQISRPEDGRDVVLTLDTNLQRAARRTLKSGAGMEDDRSDFDWYREPVGAAVLLAVNGDVLAAASEPNLESEVFEGARMQRTLAIERTLRRPTFQPPGSVFKVFVAAYALSELGLDPATIVDCTDIDGHAGYKDVHCHRRFGHAELGLRRAISGSCNSYFAWLGETLTDSDLRAVSSAFGFEDPVGVRVPPPWDDGLRRRSGAFEDIGGLTPLSHGLLGDHDRRLAGNGLGAVQATPMQLARAMLALATGELHDLRLVRRIGDRELPLGKTQPLGFDSEALEFVRAAMVDVTDPSIPNSTGTVLAKRELGFQVAVKTGSADYSSRKVRFRGDRVVPKHTWIAGWAPAENPAVVFVIFVHDTKATSSHGAIYLAREFLRQPEVLAYMASAGVDVSEVPAR